MKNRIFIGGLIALIAWGAWYAVKTYQGIENDLYDSNTKNTSTSSSAEETSSPSNNPSKIVTCTRDIEAFSPYHPSEIIGKFLKNSKLTILRTDVNSGKVLVLYKTSEGEIIRALCRAKDLQP